MKKAKKALIAGLPAGVGVSKAPNGRGRKYWRVRLGKKFTGGRPYPKCFDTLSEAKEWIFGEGQNEKAPSVAMVDLKRQAGASGFELSSSQLSEAMTAIRNLGDIASLTEAVDYFLQHARPVGGIVTIQEAIDTLIKDKEAAGKGERHTNGLRWNLERFADDHEKLHLHEVAREHIEEWLQDAEFSTTTRRNYIRDLSILFNFALKREWVARIPLVGITKPTPESGEIRILSPEDTAELLQATKVRREIETPLGSMMVNLFEDITAPLAIKLFAGLRTSELFQLDWANVKESQIVIEAKTAKTRKRRVVSISENLQAWLEGHRKVKGPVTELKYNAWHRKLQSLVGYVNGFRKHAKTGQDYNFRLPPNFARHSFCSYHYALHRNENLTAAEAGNSPNVIFSNYREMVAPEAAKAYWEIRPASPAPAA
jgi:integrase